MSDATQKCTVLNASSSHTYFKAWTSPGRLLLKTIILARTSCCMSLNSSYEQGFLACSIFFCMNCAKMAISFGSGSSTVVSSGSTPSPSAETDLSSPSSGRSSGETDLSSPSSCSALRSLSDLSSPSGGRSSGVLWSSASASLSSQDSEG